MKHLKLCFLITLFVYSCSLPEVDYTESLNEQVQLFDSLTQQSVEQADSQILNMAQEILKNLQAEFPDSSQTKKMAEFDFKDAKEQINKKLEKLEIEKTNALSKLRASTDDFKDNIYYSDKSSPKYVNRNGFYLDFAVSKEDKSFYIPNLNIQYYADSWLFVERITFLIDDEKIEYTAGNMKRDNEGGKIWEYTSKSVDAADKLLINKIIDSKVSKMRFHGKQYHDDRTITSQQKKALKNVRDTYILIGGNW